MTFTTQSAPRKAATAGIALGLALAVTWWLDLGAALDNADAGEPAVDRLREIGGRIEAMATAGPSHVEATVSGPATAAAVSSPPYEPLNLLSGPAAAARASLLPARDWRAEVTIDEIEILAVVESSLGAVARARCRRDAPRRCPGTLLLRAGDRLHDGDVDWIGFFSLRLAAVRLKQRPWPPPCSWFPAASCRGKPYREVLRVLGWDAFAGDRGRPTGANGEPARVDGPEAVGSWPEGRYLPRHQALTRRIAGERLPRVDLFAAIFHESFGMMPWQHPAWSPRGWTVAEGFPWLGTVRELTPPPDIGEPAGDATSTPAATAVLSIVDRRLALDVDVLEEPGIWRYRPGTRPDPFRSLSDPGGLPYFKRGQRPPGVAGLSIDDVVIDAIDPTPAGPVAEVRVAGWFRPLTLEAGDRLLDGVVIDVNAFEVVFRQKVDDPLALKPFREVVKRFDRDRSRR